MLEARHKLYTLCDEGWQKFSVMNDCILGFMCHMVSITTSQAYHCSMKLVIDKIHTSECSYYNSFVFKKLPSWISPMSYSLPISAA